MDQSSQKLPMNHSWIDHDQWRDILRHFADVLQMNIFIVDCNGGILLAPEEGKSEREEAQGLDKFEKHGNYLEFKHHFGVHSFALPMNGKDGNAIAYMMVGPVNLNKRPASVSKNEPPIVSLETIKSILDLLKEISRYILELSFEEQRFSKMRFNREILPAQVSEAAHDIYSSICLDELLVTLLDTALSLLKVECGSIMVLDQEKLIIKVSRGIDAHLTKDTPMKIGDGIAGLALKENTSFVINGTKSDHRIKHLLKRPEIKHSLVMPIGSDNNVFGVLNLHTKVEKNNITDENLSTVTNLSRLTSAAINNIQRRMTSPRHNSSQA